MPHAGGQLKREIGLFQAVLLGLGSILGTGVFVSIGIAAGVAGPAVLVAIVLAALLALCNGLSSAQLAAAHPVAGGTYEYGYRYLNDKLGFTAGWMFLCAKSASAATAALAVSALLGTYWRTYLHGSPWVVLAPTIVFVFAGVVCLGVRRSNLVNAVIVLITIAGLLCYIVTSSMAVIEFDRIGHFATTFKQYLRPAPVFTATALMFVAYTGYGRIATLGEEVHHPRRTIPKAIWVTLLISALLYCGVGYTVGYAGPLLEGSPAPLAGTAYVLGVQPWVIPAISIAAITAMLGVLLNLILGLSRVVLAMGRRGDMPALFARVNAKGTTPVPAVLAVAAIIMALTLIGDIKATWSFAAFTVLIYYGITNLACLRLPEKDRLYPRLFAWVGLLGCFFLAWWVEPRYWVIGLLVIVVGLVWRGITQVRHPYVREVPDAHEFCVQCGYDLRASEGVCPECGVAIPEADAVVDAS